MLYEVEDETVGHLFLTCSYSKAVWGSFTSRTADGDAKVSGASILDPDFHVGELIEAIEKFSPKSECWGGGLHWLGLAAFIWHIWGERLQGG